jgi:hypothetical protein
VAPDAVAVAQQITPAERGTAIVTTEGGWVRARSLLVTADQARSVAETTRHLTPTLPFLTDGGTAK